MSTAPYTTEYDLELKSQLPHLANYPEYLPFIGSSWNNQTTRFLFLGESHYLPKTSNGKSNSTSWYNRTSADLTPYDHQHIHTRGVVIDADSQHYFNNAYSIFYNLKSTFFAASNRTKSKECIFSNFSYYNYFQRPAEVTGRSINNCKIDDAIAYSTLKVLTDTIKPSGIIFLSKKAYQSFLKERDFLNDGSFENVSIEQVPHPASAWWNKKSRAYNNLSGKEKLIKIIKRSGFCWPNDQLTF